jgi:hypothetical protein
MGWEVRVGQLTDKKTKAFKLRFIGLVGAVAVAITLAVGVYSEPRATPLMLGFLLVGMLTALAWSVRRDPWALADEVVDEGNCLVVRRRSAQARVAFDDIADVDRDATIFARHVRLTLARAIPSFGTEVVFRPRDYSSMTTQELNRLIEELRSRAPATASPQRAPERRDSLAADGWASHRTLTQKRVILACAGLLIALAAGNYLLGLKMFVPFDKQVMLGCIVVAAIVMHFFAPTVAETDGQIDAKITRKRLERESR